MAAKEQYKSIYGARIMCMNEPSQKLTNRNVAIKV